MRLCILLFCFSSVLSEHTSDVESRLVQINSGLVRGYKDSREDIFVFYGIPYATAPNGTQRFKGPLPPPSWNNAFEAVDKGIICIQLKIPEKVPEFKIMKVDCLIANVYVPRTEKKDLPVVVYVHGGAFVLGFGNLLTPNELVSSQEVIAVTFNYRVGAYGFLCLGTGDVPGNAGLKDQVALLRWVKNNIASFGGNPNDVTLAGYSAGSSSVDLLMISKMSKGLFNKVIPESCSSIAPFSLQVDPIQSAKEYAKIIGIDTVDDIVELENSFKNVSYELLQSGNLMKRKDFTFLLGPCVEKDNGQEMFLNEDPLKTIKRGDFPKLPMLYGFSNMEGLLYLDKFDLWKKEMNKNFENFLPVDLSFQSEEEKVLTANKIKAFYFGDRKVNNDSILSYIDYISDILFACPILRDVNYLLEAGHNKIFLYRYSYTDENTPLVPHTNVRGANHCAQSAAVLYKFEPYLTSNFSYTNDFLKMRSIMRNLWGNFIKNGKPSAPGTPEWPSVGINGSPYMELKKNLELRGSLLEERCLFWKEIYNLHLKLPIHFESDS